MSRRVIYRKLSFATTCCLMKGPTKAAFHYEPPLIPNPKEDEPVPLVLKQTRLLRRISPSIPTTAESLTFKYRHLTALWFISCQSGYNSLRQEGVLKLPGGY